MTTPVIAPGTCPPTFTAPGSYGPDVTARFIESASEMWRVSLEGFAGYWVNALQRGATPLDVSRDVSRWYAVSTQRRIPDWVSPNEVVQSSPISQLRDFSQGSTDRVVPTLVLPPQAGHHSCIVDFSPQQSQMQVIRAAGLTRAYSMQWLSATQETKDTSVEDYLEDIERAIAHIDGPVNLVGDCQGGWLAAIYAALRPNDVHTLTIAGAPIDFHAGGAVIHDYVQLFGKQDQTPGDLSFYRHVVGLGRGLLKGEFMLNGFIGMKPEAEVEKQLQLLVHLHEPQHIERYQVFEDWFKHTQDIAGAFYLWIVEHLFRDNKLIEGRLEVGGESVLLDRIRCPLHLLAGAVDHITPPEQVFAMADAVATPEAKVTRRTTSGGHLGLFMGREALRDYWPPIMAAVFEDSKAGARREPARRRARATTAPARKPVIPAP